MWKGATQWLPFWGKEIPQLSPRPSGRGYSVASLLGEAEPKTLPPLGHVEGGYSVAFLLGEGYSTTLPQPSGGGLLSSLPSGGRGLSSPLPFRSRWLYLCSYLPHEGERPNEPSPPGHYHPRFPLMLHSLFPTDSVSLLPFYALLFPSLGRSLLISKSPPPYELPNFPPLMTCLIFPSLLWLSSFPSPHVISIWFRVWQPSIPTSVSGAKSKPPTGTLWWPTPFRSILGSI